MNIQSIKNFFIHKKENNKNQGKIKAFFSQLSRGLMIPIAILPIAGLLLGIGGAIGANVKTDLGQVFANIFKGMSDVVFANLPLLFCIAITITFSKDKGASGFMSALAFLVFSSSQLAFIQFDTNGNPISIMWFHKEIVGITTKTLGMTTLQTSIFGGIVVGGITSIIYNKFSTKKLPSALDFFSGIRLVPFILIPTMFLLSLMFLIFWPWVGQLIFLIGKGIQRAPYGTGGLLYGMLGRSLMPFGLHHIPIVMAFQTEFGGVLEGELIQKALENQKISTDSEIYKEILKSWTSFTSNDTFSGSIVGDQNIWNFINSISLNTINSTPLFQWFDSHVGVYAGRFTQDYPTYLGACIGIGAAMIMTSEKENRKKVATIIGSSMIVAFLTGITEPLEFSFLFCAPALYYLLYVPISGFSYMFMEILGAHVGVGFARGFIDLIIYGAVPILKGTNFYWAFVLAAAEGLLMFGSFWFFIKKFDLATPGRNGNPMTLISKKDYNEMKAKNQDSSKNNDEKVKNIIEYLGQLDNLVEVSACATRLRVTVKDINNVQKDKFIVTGSKGIILKGNGIQIIYGGEAALLADKINDIIQQQK
ncbi:PTS transporter subunit EIIC [Mesomycoplasma moatsii]|uniref:PTS transporter subunit EIIC n=1 Tax=Mesomycoplasma moatsii TaxID=171287 RepID=UPI0004289E07